MEDEDRSGPYLADAFTGIHGIAVVVPWGGYGHVEIKCLGQHIAFPTMNTILPFNGVICDFTEDTMIALEAWVKMVKKEFKKRKGG